MVKIDFDLYCSSSFTVSPEVYKISTDASGIFNWLHVQFTAFKVNSVVLFVFISIVMCGVTLNQ